MKKMRVKDTIHAPWTMQAYLTLLAGSENCFWSEVHGPNGDGIKDQKRIKEFEGLSPALKDAIYIKAMSNDYLYGRTDWLRFVDKISPERREESLEILVRTRLMQDHRLPLWLMYVFVCCKEQKISIKQEWRDILGAAMLLYRTSYNYQSASSYQYEEVVKWLEKDARGNE